MNRDSDEFRLSIHVETSDANRAWKRYSSQIPSYVERVLSVHPDLSETTILYGNLLVQSVAGQLAPTVGPGLLPPYLDTEIQSHRKAHLKTQTPRPRTWEDVAEGSEEWHVAHRWASHVLQDDRLSAKFARWAPEILDVTAEDPFSEDGGAVSSTAVDHARIVLMSRFWPRQARLTAEGTNVLYTGLFGDLDPPLELLGEFLRSTRARPTQRAVTIVVWHWMKESFSPGRERLQLSRIRRELTAARRRSNQKNQDP